MKAFGCKPFDVKFINVHPGNVEKLIILLVVVLYDDFVIQPELLNPPGILLGNGSFVNNKVGKVKVNGDGVGGLYHHVLLK